MGEIIMVSSLRDSGGVSFYDLTTGSPFSHALKNCMCETGGLGVIGGSSSFSGKSGQGSGDYIVASQSKKPVINIWQWGKPQVQMQCRIQELTPSICVDTNGFYIFGGTKGGRIFCWEVSSGDLVMSWQAHYKAVTTMVMSSCGTFLVSGAEDGMIRTWDVPTLLTSPRGSGSKKNIPPFRSWTPHSLPIANIILQQAGVFSPSNFRAISVSADRTITIQEIYSNRQVAKIAFPEALTSCTSNHTMDVVYLGSASGRIYIMDLSVTAVALSAAHAKVIHADTGVSSSLNSTSFTGDGSSGGGSTSKNTHTLQEGNYSILIGHDKAVTSLVLARDNYTLVSVSMDGTVKIWNTISRQCLKEINPYNKAPLSNVMLLLRPEVIDGHGISSIHKPTLCPISHLRKYPDSNDKSSNSGSSSVTQLDGNASLKGRNRRFVGGQSYCDERKNPLDLVSNPDLLQPVDTSYRSIQPAQGHATSASMPGGEYVSLRPPEAPESDFSNMDVLPSPPVMSRQDTFGDEFYDNWKKNVRVRSVDSKSGLSAITETILDDSTEISTLSLEMQVQAWKRLASELQNQISNDSVCQEESESETDELEEIESPKAQPSTQKKKKSGPAMIVLSETDRFKVPKNKGSGGGRKRYHEVYLEEQEREIAKKDEESAVKKMKKENKVGSQTSKTGVKVSKATPPQARTRRSKK